MSFAKIIGQPLAVKLVQRWLEKKTNQPLLFYGPEGAGKCFLALEIAKALNCQVSPLDPCGRCLSCRKIDSRKHPDVRVVDLDYQAAVREEPLEKQQFLRIETVLDERKRLYQTAGEATWKISILDDAHRLTPDAANVLLKVLEEPPQRTALFLLTPYRDRLFSTLVSRCQSVRFRPRPESESSRPEQSPGATEAETLWEKLPRLTPEQILAKQEPRSRTTAASRVDVEAQLRSLLSPAVRELRLGRRKAAEKVELIQQAQQQLRQNVPPALVYDHLLLQLSKVL